MGTSEPLGGSFGETIKTWFAKNDWPQIVAEQVARAKGSKIGPWASQMSNCMQGKLTPKPSFFVALGWFNEVVTTREFSGITDRRLMDRLLSSQPLTHDDGTPYTATDFFALYIGAIEPPKDFSTPEVFITQEDVDQWTSDIRSLFHGLVLDLMMKPREVWDLMEQKLQERGIVPDDMLWLQELLTGLREATVDEMLRLVHRYPSNPVSKTMLELCNNEKAKHFVSFTVSKTQVMDHQEKKYPSLG